MELFEISMRLLSVTLKIDDLVLLRGVDCSNHSSNCKRSREAKDSLTHHQVRYPKDPDLRTSLAGSRLMNPDQSPSSTSQSSVVALKAWNYRKIVAVLDPEVDLGTRSRKRCEIWIYLQGPRLVGAWWALVNLGFFGES